MLSPDRWQDVNRSTKCQWEHYPGLDQPRARMNHECECCRQAIVPGEHYIRSVSGAFHGGSKLCWRCAWYLFGRNGVLSEPAEPEPGTMQKIACGRGCLTLD